MKFPHRILSCSESRSRLTKDFCFVKVAAENDVFIAIWGGFQSIVKGVIKRNIVVIVISTMCIQKQVMIALHCKNTTLKYKRMRTNKAV